MRAVGCDTRGMPRAGGIGGQAPQPPRVTPPAPVAQGRIAEADDGLGIVPVMNVSDITRQLGKLNFSPMRTFLSDYYDLLHRLTLSISIICT